MCVCALLPIWNSSLPKDREYLPLLPPTPPPLKKKPPRNIHNNFIRDTYRPLSLSAAHKQWRFRSLLPLSFYFWCAPIAKSIYRESIVTHIQSFIIFRTFLFFYFASKGEYFVRSTLYMGSCITHHTLFFFTRALKIL